MPDLTLLSICGSLRALSTNRLLLDEAARLFAPLTHIKADIRLPLFDDDIQQGQGLPEEVHILAQQIAAADAVIIASPEYNKGISGALKNALDWVSRVDHKPWLHKPVALMTAAAGRSGGERGQAMLHHCMLPFRPKLINGPELLLAQTGAQWDENGRLTNARTLAALDDLMSGLRAEAEHASA